MIEAASLAVRAAAIAALVSATATQAAAPRAKTPPPPPPAVVPQLPAQPNPQILDLPVLPVIAADKRACLSRTPSGLGYSVLRPGSGASPATGDVTLINYIGYLAANGQAFDQSMRAVLEVDRVVPGFAEGLKLATRGAVLRLCIPAALGYGERAIGPIPANSDLVFQIELIDFRNAAEMRRQQAVPPVAPPPPPAGAPE